MPLRIGPMGQCELRDEGILGSSLRKDQISLFWRMPGSSRACYYERIRSGGSLGKEHAR
jgi:hypothetical protein